MSSTSSAGSGGYGCTSGQGKACCDSGCLTHNVVCHVGCEAGCQGCQGGCQGCNSCNSCQGCNSCNSCQSCNASCNGGNSCGHCEHCESCNTTQCSCQTAQCTSCNTSCNTGQCGACQSCQSCNVSCNTGCLIACQGCVSCVTCQATCQLACQACNVTCISQRPSNFGWTSLVVQGGFIKLSAAEWNQFTAKVNAFRKYKGQTEVTFTQAVAENPITAAITNEAIAALQSLSAYFTGGYTLPAPKVRLTDLITADDLIRLRDSLNSIG